MKRMTVVLALALLAACSSSSGKTASSSSGSSGSSGSSALNGVFTITAGTCDTSTPSGSFFRMVQSGGTPAAGPFVSNSDSTCADQTVTPLSPGDDGGLRTGAFQNAMLRPQPFFGVPFEVSTNAKDPQTGATVKAPSIAHNGSTLTGDLSAVSVAWNSQQFNQGAPKPGGPASDGPKGTYDETTHKYTLEWTSPIEGGPFNGFTGMWHLEGTFQPS